MQNKLLVILGPTATGKTDLALQLARKIQGELISADSRQVYKGLDIGTGKYPSNESKAVKIWMYDVANPKDQYHVARFVKDAEKIISEVYRRKKVPILVGGTGLYIRALICGFSDISVPLNKTLRKNLETKTLSELQKQIKKVSPKRWDEMNYSDQQNPRRLIRAIEIATSPRRSPFSHLRGGLYETLKIGLTARRVTLYKNADKGVVSRIKQGMIVEAKNLRSKGLSFERMKKLGLEYGVLADYLEGKIRKNDLINILQGKIHGYIRRQLTWFKKEEQVNWFDITDKQYLSKIEKMVGIWYDNPSTNASKNRHFP